ncbi:MAG: DUF4340 domain-containing protein [Deltaproteobacteria bacterium]|nr:DUF4340 domain-containing protein [Deltaproteobacteria bacterium]
MTAWRAWAYMLLFAVLAAYYLATEPRSQEPVPQAPAARQAFLALAKDDVRAVTIEHGSVTVECVREGARWRVQRPAGSRIPSDLIAALLDQLTEVPEVEVVDESGQGAAAFGLEPPQARVILTGSDGRRVAVALGERNPAQTAVYGRVEGAARIVLLGLNVIYYQELIAQGAGPG